MTDELNELRAIAGRIYDVLVEHAGASLLPRHRDQFVAAAVGGYASEYVSEYRFGGALGFGGKVWTDRGRICVTCYPEDETPERRAVLDATNAALFPMAAAWREAGGGPC